MTDDQPMNKATAEPGRGGRSGRRWYVRAWRRLMNLIWTGDECDRELATVADVHMMKRAIDEARRAWQVDEVPVGAVVYRGDQVLAVAHNLRESDSDPTAHAEILALREAARKLGEWRLNECTLVVTLEPCPMCAGAIVNARVGRLVYGATDPKAGAVDSIYQMCDDRRLNHQPKVIGGVLAPECRGVLREFFKERRRMNKLARRAGGDS